MSRVILVIFLMLAVSSSCYAQTFKVVGDDDFPPFSFVDESGKLAGIDIDILEELSDRLGVDFDIELVPWKRLLLMTQTGAVFGSFSLFRTPERESYSLFTYPLHYSTFKLFTSSKNAIKFDRIEDLYGKRIAIAAGFSVSQELEAAHARGDLTLLEIYSYMDSFRRLLKGGIDAFVGNDLVVEHQLKKKLSVNPEFELIDSLAVPIERARGAYFVLSKNYPIDNREQWQNRIAKTLKAIEEEGITRSIVERYMR